MSLRLLSLLALGLLGSAPDGGVGRDAGAPADVPCRRDFDCWVTDESPPRPIARPRGLRRRFRGCVDGEVPPVCLQGVCALGRRYGC